ncbi:MAG: hypothetical protein ACTSXD_05050 [Candidatus Heimdallarchaeaceae archaeon]
MEKQECQKLFKKIIKNHKRKLKLIFSENYPNPNHGGCINPYKGEITINWTKMKDKSEDRITDFFCHEIAHDVLYWWFRKEIKKLEKEVEDMRNLINSKKEKESLANNIGLMFKKNKLKGGIE